MLLRPFVESALDFLRDGPRLASHLERLCVHPLREQRPLADKQEIPRRRPHSPGRRLTHEHPVPGADLLNVNSLFPVMLDKKYSRCLPSGRNCGHIGRPSSLLPSPGTGAATPPAAGIRCKTLPRARRKHDRSIPAPGSAIGLIRCQAGRNGRTQGLDRSTRQRNLLPAFGRRRIRSAGNRATRRGKVASSVLSRRWTGVSSPTGRTHNHCRAGPSLRDERDLPPVRRWDCLRPRR